MCRFVPVLLGTLASSHIPEISKLGLLVYELFMCECFRLFVRDTDRLTTHTLNSLNPTFVEESEVLFDDGEQGDDGRLEVLIVEHIPVLCHIS